MTLIDWPSPKTPTLVQKIWDLC